MIDEAHLYMNVKCVMVMWDIIIYSGLGKKLDAISKKKDCEDVGLWKKSILNHLYYVAASAHERKEELGVPDVEEVIEAMWVSVANHVMDIHEHDNPLYLMCEHPPLVAEEREKQWLHPRKLQSVRVTLCFT